MMKRLRRRCRTMAGRTDEYRTIYCVFVLFAVVFFFSFLSLLSFLPFTFLFVGLLGLEKSWVCISLVCKLLCAAL